MNLNPTPDKMAKIQLLVLLTTLAIQLAQSHPLAVLRIQSNLDAEQQLAVEGSEAEILLATADLNTGGSAAEQLIQLQRSLVEQPQAILINVAYPGADEDLILAETQIFRPLFVYKQQKAKRIRLGQI